MSDVIIKIGEWPSPIIDNVFLDGIAQRGLGEINLTQGYVRRAYRGKPFFKHHYKMDSGYVWDPEIDDYVMETAFGEVFVKWIDVEKARVWLAKHGQ